VNGPTNGVWRRGDGSNLVGVPTARLASAAFNDEKAELRIAGVRADNDALFVRLAAVETLADAAAVFTDHMAGLFGLTTSRPVASANGERRHYRSSYLRLLRGWAYDANGPEGAVLKGWVESRFGLVPTFHKEALTQYRSPAWLLYVEQKMGSRFHNNAIYSQLDVVYEFSQWALRRFFGPDPHWKLYRGINDFEEHQIVEKISKNVVVLRLNNLVSFTFTRDIASCFGDYMLETRVPFAKIFAFNGLLDRDPLRCEGEVLVIGGDYRVKATYY
jgi:NAD+--dinitrogen-reductase ADP-D-ribosyltransferase